MTGKSEKDEKEMKTEETKIEKKNHTAADTATSTAVELYRKPHIQTATRKKGNARKDPRWIPLPHSSTPTTVCLPFSFHPLLVHRLSLPCPWTDDSVWGLSCICAELNLDTSLGRAVLQSFPFGGVQDLVLFLCVLFNMTSDGTESMTSLGEEFMAYYDRWEWFLSSALTASTAGLNRRGPYGYTPLMIVFCKLRLIRVLLTFGADPDLCDHEGHSFLDRVLTLNPQYVPLGEIRALLVECLRAGLFFHPHQQTEPVGTSHQNSQHNSVAVHVLNRFHPALKHDPVVVRMLREVDVLPRKDVPSLMSLCRCAIVKQMRASGRSVHQGVLELGRPRTDNQGQLSKGITVHAEYVLQYDDFAAVVTVSANHN